ncbi:MAG: cation-transporting P-type ATPase [Candidatus Curtissbacteria bacterium]|nr:cation-transporting P-type ATPase [Candidatus Curtissbacteria bacterium]
MNYYQKSTRDVLDELSTSQDGGLSYDQAASRLRTFGSNILASKKKETLADIFLRQFKSPLIYILIFAAILVSFFGKAIDAIVIILVITINAVVGTIQEGKAKNSLEKLQSLTRHKALVRRDSEEILVSSEEVVPGDILIIHEGDRISADSRIIIAESLKVDESVLTGEAYAVEKTSGTQEKQNLTVGDQKNMLFTGTNVVSGYAEAVVVATGFNSELGKISKGLLETSNVPLPLAKKVTQLTHFVAKAAIGVSIFVLIVGFVRGMELSEILTSVIGLTVSIVPEGLPVAVTIVLAKGVWRMAKAKAIVRQMAAVEAMGNADTLLVDKTGTITTGKMVIRKILINEKAYEVTGEGYKPKGIVKEINQKDEHLLKKIMGLTYLSLKADVVKLDGRWKPTGDPTEVAVAVLARKVSLKKVVLEKEYKTIKVSPFDSKKRYIEAEFEKGEEIWKVYIGAPEFLSRDLKIDHNLSSNYHHLAQEGLRVIGVAIFGPKKKLFSYALLAIDEEIRKNVEKSIEEAKAADFKVAMITGDFEETAKTIAKKVGIFKDGDEVLTGKVIENLTMEQLREKVRNVTVFARISPVHKLKIVNALNKNGRITAMTGDGVNDGPALQAASLGIGLGSGTQVAKDASDIILTNDNFKTIVAAIAEGRAIYLTLKKVILYLFSTTVGEVLAITLSILIGLPLPLVAVQIIWLNFVTDGFFVVALAQDPPESGLMSKGELRSDALVDPEMVKRVILMSTTMILVTLPIFYVYQKSGIVEGRSMALLILAVTQWFNALNVRSKTKSVFQTPIFNNHYLTGTFVIVFILQFLALQTPVGNQLLHTSPLTLTDWAIAFLASTAVIITEEIRKLSSRSRTRN